MIVVLAEKKSLAEKIAKALGKAVFKKDHYEVAFGKEKVLVYYLFGHLLKTDVSKSLGGEFPSFPSRLSLAPDGKRKSLFFSVKKALEEVKKSGGKVYCAGDPDREGELLVREVLNYCKVPKSICYRMWWNSETKEELKRAFLEAKPLSHYDHLFTAGRSRQLGDFWLGINCSKALQRKTSVYNLSLGRVQTPVLKLIADREEEIENFKPEKYFVVLAVLEKDNVKFKAVYKTKDLLKDKELAESVFKALKEADRLKVVKVQKKKRKVSPPKLPKLSDLQKEVGRKLGLTAKEVLSIVQSLYEREILSYPRTDSNYLSTKDEELVVNFLKQVGRNDLIPAIDEYSSRIFNDKDVERAGHHAIIPLKPADNLSKKEQAVYDAVVKRLLANLHPEAVVEKTVVHLQVDGKDYLFETVGEVVVNRGWYEVYDKTADGPLPQLTEGEKVKKLSQKLEEKETQPPPRYTSASLIAKMEKLGLGTQATRHTYEEVLIKRGYVERRGGKLYLTENGRKLTEAVRELEISSPELTAEWEKVLKQIAEKKVSPKEGEEKFLSGIKSLTLKTIEQLEKSSISIKRPPTQKMVRFARKLAKERGIKLDKSVLSSFEETKRFIEKCLRK